LVVEYSNQYSSRYHEPYQYHKYVKKMHLCAYENFKALFYPY